MLQSDEVGVFGLINHPHTTATAFIENAVVRDSFADERVGAWHAQDMLGCARRASQRRQISRKS